MTRSLRAAIETHSGHVFKTIGDAFCAAFARPQDAVAAMLDAQQALMVQDVTAEDGIWVRAAIHVGTADERDGDYFGPTVNRVARLLAIGHGGQVLVSGVAADLVLGLLPQRATLRDLGAYRLKDLAQREQVYQLLTPDLRTDFPPLRSLDALPNNLPRMPTSFIGRETEIAEITALMRGCPQLKLLASSRQGLGIAGEMTYRMPSLGIPEIADATALTRPMPQALPQSRYLANAHARSISALCSAMRTPKSWRTSAAGSTGFRWPLS